MTRAALGTFVHARSGDKGGDANLGLWVAHDGADQATYDARVDWLFKMMSPRKVRMTSAMINAWKITRMVSPMPPSFRFAPDVTLIGLLSVRIG